MKEKLLNFFFFFPFSVKPTSLLFGAIFMIKLGSNLLMRYVGLKSFDALCEQLTTTMNSYVIKF